MKARLRLTVQARRLPGLLEMTEPPARRVALTPAPQDDRRLKVSSIDFNLRYPAIGSASRKAVTSSGANCFQNDLLVRMGLRKSTSTGRPVQNTLEPCRRQHGGSSPELPKSSI